MKTRVSVKHLDWGIKVQIKTSASRVETFSFVWSMELNPSHDWYYWCNFQQRLTIRNNCLAAEQFCWESGTNSDSSNNFFGARPLAHLSSILVVQGHILSRERRNVRAKAVVMRTCPYVRDCKVLRLSRGENITWWLLKALMKRFPTPHRMLRSNWFRTIKKLLLHIGYYSSRLIKRNNLDH